MRKNQILTVLIALFATAMFVIPGLAFGKGGNGTPNPPPTNPPCDADGHDGLPPPYAGPHKNSGSCDHGTGNATGSTGGTETTETTETGSSSTSSGSSSSGSSSSSTGSSSSSSTSGSSTSSSSTSSSSSSSSTTAASTATTGDVCETDGLLGGKGLGLNSPDNRTIGQILWDELALVVQDPHIAGVGDEGGPLSQPIYDGLIQIPLGGFETPIAAEVGCLLNNLSL